MTNSSNQIRDRYPGIRSFDKGEERLFFGRRQETDDLLSLVKTRTLVVLFSKSGIGKSSLINAGLIPKLEAAQFFPIVVRFQSTDSSPLDILDRMLTWYVDAEKLARFAPADGKIELWHKLKASRFFNTEVTDKKQTANPSAESLPLQTPVFIFDQFEEIFGHDPEKRAEFTRQLADLADSRLPSAAQERLLSTPRSERTPEMLDWFTPANVHFLFAIRSDRLHQMNEMTGAIPSVLSSRFELKPLNRRAAREAIEEPAKLDDPDFQFATPPFAYDEETMTDILDNLSTIKADEIESFQLQILCGEIEKKVKTRVFSPQFGLSWSGSVSPDYLGGAEGIKAILNNYYENQIHSLGDDTSQQKARQLIEDQLIADKKRIGAAVETVLLPKDLVEKLLASRVIRISNTHLGDIFEISHDTLVEPIVKSRDERRRREESIRLEKEHLEQEKALAEQTARLEEQTRLREQAEGAKNEAFLQKDKAERNARRAYWFTVSSMILLVSSIVFGYFSLKQEKDGYLQQADFLQKQKQFSEAANVYKRLLDKDILIFTGYDRDSVERTVRRMELLDSIRHIVAVGDSLYFVGDYWFALENYEKAKTANYEGILERMERTRQISDLSFEIFSRKAETFSNLAESDLTDTLAISQACFFLEKALRLKPEDDELKKRQEALGCKK